MEAKIKHWTGGYNISHVLFLDKNSPFTIQTKHLGPLSIWRPSFHVYGFPLWKLNGLVTVFFYDGDPCTGKMWLLYWNKVQSSFYVLFQITWANSQWQKTLHMYSKASAKERGPYLIYVKSSLIGWYSDHVIWDGTQKKSSDKGSESTCLPS